MSDKEEKPRARGLRDVATLQTLGHGGQPRDRHQLVSRFARLENERARLERELGMWETRKAATEDKLAKVYEQIEALRPLLLEDPAKLPVKRSGRGHRRPRASTEVAGPAAPPSQNIAIEY